MDCIELQIVIALRYEQVDDIETLYIIGGGNKFYKCWIVNVTCYYILYCRINDNRII